MSNYTNAFTGRIIQAMEEQIAKHGLNLLSCKPDDLYELDAAVLERAAQPGVTIAWMVGHDHTQISVLGGHERGNNAVMYHTNMADEDRFYVLKIGQSNFTMQELDRSAYKALSKTPIPYSQWGDKANFWVTKHGIQVGHIAIEVVGSHKKPRVNAVITPVAGIPAQDRSVLMMWASYEATEVSRTWMPVRFVWSDPVSMRQVA